MMMVQTLVLAAVVGLTGGFQVQRSSSARHGAVQQLRFQMPAAPAADVEVPKPYEAFGAIAAEAAPVTAAMADLPPAVDNIATKSVVALGALATFAVMPGSSAIISAVGGVLGGALVRMTVAPTLVEGRYKSLVAKVAATLRDAGSEWEAVPPAEIAEIVSGWGLPQEYSDASLGSIYARYLVEVCKTGEVSTAEIAQLGQLQAVLSLSSMAVGAAYCEASLELYRQVQWSSYADPKQPADSTVEGRRVNKLLFLCDRAFGEESDEARAYELGRVRKIMQLEDPEDASKRVQLVSMPFYERALVGTVAKLESVDSEMLARTRAKLGVDDVTARKMALECMSEEVRRILESSEEEDVVVSETDFERLEALGAVLGLNETERYDMLDKEVRPIFEREAAAICEAAFEAESADGAAEALAKRQSELRLEASTGDALVASACRGKMVEVYEAAEEALQQSKSEALFFAGELARTHSIASKLMRSAIVSGADDFINATLNGHVKSKAFSRTMYDAFLTDTIGKGSLDEQQAEELDSLRELLGIREDSARSMLTKKARPALEEFLAEPLRTADFDKAKLEAFVATLRLPRDVFVEETLKVFESQLRRASESQPMLSEKTTEYLEKLREYLSLTTEQVAPFVERISGPVYKKSALEAMAASGAGIIVDDYVEGLAKLQARLGLTAEMADRCFEDAVETKVGMFIKGIDDSLTQSRTPSFHSGFQAGLDTFMNDCCTFADFLVKNKGLATPPSDTSSSGLEVDGPAWTYKVTAYGMLEDKHAFMLYSEFVKRSLAAAETASLSRVSRYFGAMPHVAGGLGLDKSDAVAIKDKIVGDFYSKKGKNPTVELESLIAKLNSAKPIKNAPSPVIEAVAAAPVVVEAEVEAEAPDVDSSQ